ncbi:UDP-N-acetylmuramoyl-tripeptide--D-alanyl-D-alanine ligase [Thaumasiovibrio subtropicus]|uniref:UDP-N-acetylmuramoyl-tripeptide--D-alanyl-D- alanine ligase n=1 Tax=Thaumasiovibrio subtropicus TaxID=1891207 RepID=UPI000B34ADA1|nr:UDP-N-acetylmuramoyl-tripeptide--D-alanyl-D-alanine ligase [Thaumasiovibrio subtropicus]
MMTYTLAQLANAVSAELVVTNQDLAQQPIHHISTDTRQLERGSLFIALKGERFDAHDFAQQAIDSGASALLVHRRLALDIPQLVVADTRIALGQLGAWLRDTLNPYTVAMTGSCGKTTVKEMTAAILGQKHQVLATAGNFNNDIGVPLTLLRLEACHEFAVMELGANHIGEIDYTTRLVKPQVALINNIAESHLEGFGSMEGVAQAKGEIFHGLPDDGVAVVNLESHDLPRWQPALDGKRVLTFSTKQADADYTASDVSLNADATSAFTLNTPEGSVAVSLSVPGEHNIANALAAAALTQQTGASLADIAAGLAEMSNVAGRVNVKALNTHLTVIDDTYNASVPAMRAAIDLLATYQGHRVLILGDMKELGKESAHLHQSIAEYAAAKHFDTVLTYGTESQIISEYCHGQHFEQKPALIEHLLEKLALMPTLSVTVLVKGGRSARMEEVVTALQETVQ